MASEIRETKHQPHIIVTDWPSVRVMYIVVLKPYYSFFLAGVADIFSGKEPTNGTATQSRIMVSAQSVPPPQHSCDLKPLEIKRERTHNCKRPIEKSGI